MRRGHPPREVRNNYEVKKFISGNPAVIGYIERSVLDDSLKTSTISP
jgi:hypothetical protein